MTFAYSAADIAALVQPRTSKGDCPHVLTGLASLDRAQAGDVSFLGNPRYKAQVATTAASLVLLPLDFVGEPGLGQQFLWVDNPSVALARLCAQLERALWPQPAAGIHASAVIDPTARIDPTATIGPLCVIEGGAVVGPRTHVQAQVFLGRAAVVGADCWLMPHVIITAECRVGDRVRLHPGVVVGADGFGYEFSRGRHEKVPQVGQVVIENEVEIGANTTLDRARFSRTVVGEGTKIDNLVQIGHNVVIGRHCLICAQVGISGSSTLEDYVVLGGQAGIAGHLTIGRGSKIDGQSGINSDLPPASSMKGTPALPYALEQRINVLRKRIPELFKRVGEIEAGLATVKPPTAS